MIFPLVCAESIWIGWILPVWSTASRSITLTRLVCLITLVPALSTIIGGIRSNNALETVKELNTQFQMANQPSEPVRALKISCGRRRILAAKFSALKFPILSSILFLSWTNASVGLDSCGARWTTTARWTAKTFGTRRVVWMILTASATITCLSIVLR